MPDLSPYVPADVLPGLLTGWIGPVEHRPVNAPDGTWVLAVVVGNRLHVVGGPQKHVLRFSRTRLDLRRPEVRDRLARVIAAVLGVPVGATAPVFDPLQMDGAWWLDGTHLFHAPGRDEPVMRRELQHEIPALATIPLDHPDRDALALAAVARWMGAEIAAGRVVPAEPTP